MDMWIISSLGFLIKLLQMLILHSCVNLFCFVLFFGKCLQVEYVILYFSYLRNCRTFSQVIVPLYLFASMTVPVAPHPHQHLAILVFLILAFQWACSSITLWFLICICLMSNSTENLLISVSSFLKFLFTPLAHFKKSGHLSWWVLRILYTLFVQFLWQI